MATGRTVAQLISASTLIGSGGPVKIHGWTFRETGGTNPVTFQLLTQPAPTSAQAAGGQGYAKATSSNATTEFAGEIIAAGKRSTPSDVGDDGCFFNGGVYVSVTGTGTIAGAVYWS